VSAQPGAAEAAAIYAAISDGYRRQLDLLAFDEPDLDALGTLAAAIDADLARLPTHLPGLSRAEADRLTEAARAADTLRAQAATRLATVHAALIGDAAAVGRAASAARAYAPAPVAGDARFLDQKR